MASTDYYTLTQPSNVTNPVAPYVLSGVTTVVSDGTNVPISVAFPSQSIPFFQQVTPVSTPTSWPVSWAPVPPSPWITNQTVYYNSDLGVLGDFSVKLNSATITVTGGTGAVVAPTDSFFQNTSATLTIPDITFSTPGIYTVTIRFNSETIVTPDGGFASTTLFHGETSFTVTIPTPATPPATTPTSPKCYPPIYCGSYNKNAKVVQDITIVFTIILMVLLLVYLINKYYMNK